MIDGPNAPGVDCQEEREEAGKVDQSPDQSWPLQIWTPDIILTSAELPAGC